MTAYVAGSGILGAVILGREPLFDEPFRAFMEKWFLKPGGRFWIYGKCNMQQMQHDV